MNTPLSHDAHISGAGVIVITKRVVRGVNDRIGSFVTRISRAVHTIVQVRDVDGNTVLRGTTYFRSIAELSVIALGVIRDVVNFVVALVTRIYSASDSVIHVQRIALTTTTCSSHARFSTITELSVVADLILRGVHDLV